ncbi:hypothetical protein TSUD_221010 [Trifolium subterraneum]|uniref:Reverse transcriptase zinc-binding domain-containing protein n=1 Tax=Trifolium subterraneum TaxID=3900 RepID=A0A2Z6N6I2_TRISU|nr:hypothetical protein TSUD_221010 [Trifolium subterraneum]
MLVDRENLLFRVSASRYRVERGRLCAGGTRGSSWWRELVYIQDGGGELAGGWFRGHISKKVGDGSDTFFWTDHWGNGTPLCERFGRLFDLAENKLVSVAEMFLLGWRDVVHLDVAAGCIWYCQVPLNVSIFAWQILRDMLPTKVNLITRCILSVADHLCVSGCGAVESDHHVFLSCSTFGSLCSLVSSWIGSSSVTAQTFANHFV